jgi:ABC-type nitrate/sulfonate/bicarbonate transport system permease component
MKWTRFLPPLVSIGVWQGLSSLGIIPAYKLPSPIGIALGVRDLVVVGMPPGRFLYEHIIHSLYRVFIGFSVAAGIAIPLGIFMGISERFRGIVDPLVEIIRPIPPLAWIPIAILWFGIGNGSAAFIIFLATFFPILLNTVSGVMSVDKLLVEVAYTLNADKTHICTKVLIPGALPAIFTGMRIGMGIGWMALVTAEFTGVKDGLGLGYMIMTARDIQRPDEIVAGMLVIGLIGICIDFGLRRIKSMVIHSY